MNSATFNLIINETKRRCWMNYWFGIFAFYFLLSNSLKMSNNSRSLSTFWRFPMNLSSRSGEAKNPCRSYSVSSFSLAEMFSALSRWSVTRSWLKLYVRIFSFLFACPTWLFLVLLIFSKVSLMYRSVRIFFSLRIAISRFLICERSSWHSTCTPVGMWVSRTALSVLFTCWPPAPLEVLVWNFMSFSGGEKCQKFSS